MRGDPFVGPLPGCSWPSPSALPPRRCAATGSGSARKGSRRRWHVAPAPCFTAPPARTSPLPGAVGLYLSAPSPPPRGGDGAPSLPARLSTGADCPQCAPTASRRQGGDRPTYTGARGRRRCRQPTRPVLKHGPRSLTRARVGGSVKTPWRNESEGQRALAEVGSRPLGAGRTTGPSRPLRRGGGA